MHILDDNRIRQLAAIPALVKEMPFLALTTGKPAKVCCGQTPPNGPAPDFQRIKASIAKLLPEGHRKILAVLGLSAARIVFKNGESVVDMTIHQRTNYT